MHLFQALQHQMKDLDGQQGEGVVRVLHGGKRSFLTSSASPAASFQALQHQV